jgi:hypothetical protein
MVDADNKSGKSSDDKDRALFSIFVLSLHAQGMQQLGKVMNPLTGKIERNLEQAQSTIDMLEMLKRKTAGNLSSEEDSLLGRLLYELQLNYVDEANRKQAPRDDEAESEKTGTDDSAGSTTDGGKDQKNGDVDS